MDRDKLLTKVYLMQNKKIMRATTTTIHPAATAYMSKWIKRKVSSTELLTRIKSNNTCLLKRNTGFLIVPIVHKYYFTACTSPFRLCSLFAVLYYVQNLLESKTVENIQHINIYFYVYLHGNGAFKLWPCVSGSVMEVTLFIAGLVGKPLKVHTAYVLRWYHRKKF